MKALVNIKNKLKLKLRKGRYGKGLAHYIKGVGKCPKCHKNPHSYMVMENNNLLCMNCYKESKEVKGCLILEGGEHYRYKEILL